jgi:cold shock protein
METGTVRWFSAEKGYGFITRDAGGEDLFAHYTNIAEEQDGRRDLIADQSVQFEVGEGKKGPVAINIRSV